MSRLSANHLRRAVATLCLAVLAGLIVPETTYAARLKKGSVTRTTSGNAPDLRFSLSETIRPGFGSIVVFVGTDDLANGPDSYIVPVRVSVNDFSEVMGSLKIADPIQYPVQPDESFGDYDWETRWPTNHTAGRYLDLPDSARFRSCMYGVGSPPDVLDSPCRVPFFEECPSQDCLGSGLRWRYLVVTGLRPNRQYTVEVVGEADVIAGPGRTLEFEVWDGPSLLDPALASLDFSSIGNNGIDSEVSLQFVVGHWRGGEDQIPALVYRQSDNRLRWWVPFEGASDGLGGAFDPTDGYRFYTTSASAIPMAGDMDGDGYDDVVTFEPDTGAFSIRPQPSLRPNLLWPGNDPITTDLSFDWALLEDWDDDGIDEPILIDRFQARVRFYSAPSIFGFEERTFARPSGYETRSLDQFAFGDFDQDGVGELVVGIDGVMFGEDGTPLPLGTSGFSGHVTHVGPDVAQRLGIDGPWAPVQEIARVGGRTLRLFRPDSPFGVLNGPDAAYVHTDRYSDDAAGPVEFVSVEAYDDGDAVQGVILLEPNHPIVSLEVDFQPLINVSAPAYRDTIVLEAEPGTDWSRERAVSFRSRNPDDSFFEPASYQIRVSATGQAGAADGPIVSVAGTGHLGSPPDAVPEANGFRAFQSVVFPTDTVEMRTRTSDSPDPLWTTDGRVWVPLGDFEGEGVSFEVPSAVTNTEIVFETRDTRFPTSPERFVTRRRTPIGRTEFEPLPESDASSSIFSNGTADIDGDGRTEIIQRSSGTSGSRVLRWDPQASRWDTILAGALNTVGGPDTILWADFDNDGSDEGLMSDGDLLEWDPTTDSFDRHVGVAPIGVDGTDPLMIAWDFDGDGWLDVLRETASCCDFPELYLHRNEGVDGRSFRFERLVARFDQSVRFFDIGDANGDRIADLLLIKGGTADIYAGLPSGGFAFGAPEIRLIVRDPWSGLEQSIRTASFGDFNGDGAEDLAITGDEFGLRLLENDGTGFFFEREALLIDDLTRIDGAEQDSTSRLDVDWADIDNDSDLDLLVAGTAARGSVVYLNDGRALRAQICDDEVLCSALEVDEIATDDVDGDGVLDVLLGERSDVPVYLGRFPGPGRSLAIRLVGTQSNRSGVGARIEVQVGNRTMVRTVSRFMAVRSTFGGAEHFGIGEAMAADQVVVRWPSGAVDLLRGVPAGGVATVTEGEADATSVETSGQRSRLSMSMPSPNPSSSTTSIRFLLPSSERVVVEVFDLRGRRVDRLVDEHMTAGEHTIVWDGRDGRGRDVGTGVYALRLSAGSIVQSRKVTLVR